jgi:hypothetical protein
LFDFVANGLDGWGIVKKTVGQILIFPQEAEQQISRLDGCTAVFARFVARKENHAPRPFGVSLKH